MIPELLPKAGKTTVQIPADATFSSKQNKKSTSRIMTNNNPDLLPEWKPLDPRFIQLRSKNYLTHSDRLFKTKEENLKLSSDVSLYECIALDIFDNDEDFDPKILDKVDIDKLYHHDSTKSHHQAELSYDIPSELKFIPPDACESDWFAPNLLIVTHRFPHDAPRLTKSKIGSGTNICMYLKMRDMTKSTLLKYLKDRDDISCYTKEELHILPAVKLLNEFFAKSPDDTIFSGRMKVIGTSPNAAEILPSALHKYNGKPILIKRTGITGLHYLPEGNKQICANHREVAINFHAFPFVAKQAFSYVNRNLLEGLTMRSCVLIEGRSSSELPEIMLGGFEAMIIDRSNIMNAKHAFTVSR